MPEQFRPVNVQVRKWRRRVFRLTPEQVVEIRALPWIYGSGRALSKKFGVSSALISKIRSGLSYKHYNGEDYTEAPTQTYYARLTDRGERYSLGSFRTAEEAQREIDQFQRTNQWPRGSVEKSKNRYRARLSLGVYDTKWAAEKAISDALIALKTRTE